LVDLYFLCIVMLINESNLVNSITVFCTCESVKIVKYVEVNTL